MDNRFGTTEDMIIQPVEENGATYMLAIDKAGLYMTTATYVGSVMADRNRYSSDRKGVKARLVALGLDPEERLRFRNLFSHAAQKRLVLLSTHIIEDVQSVCGQIVVLNHGNILFSGSPAELIRLACGHVGTFWENEAPKGHGLSITARVNTSQGIRCRTVSPKLPDFARAEEPTLEDAYLYLLSKEAAE